MTYRFIDLFAGIGGFHLALHRLGAECVFASEIDPAARKTYARNHAKWSPALFEGKNFNDDIRNVDPAAVPDHDILCAGFPCQPFSQAGHKLGFQDAANDRGNMFFILSRIIAAKRPRAFFLENVRHLVKHDNGATMETILRVLRNDLQYDVFPKIVKASDYGLPQHRPRIFLIGFRKEDRYPAPFVFPAPIPLKFTMSEVWNGDCDRDVGFTLRVGGRSSDISDRRNWDHYRVNGEVRQLGPVEGARMMGFPDDFEFPVPKTQAMKQLGNSVAVDAVQVVAESVIERLNTQLPDLAGRNGRSKQVNKGEASELLTVVSLLLNGELTITAASSLPLLVNTQPIRGVTKKCTSGKLQITREPSEVQIRLDDKLLRKVSLKDLAKLKVTLEKCLSAEAWDGAAKRDFKLAVQEGLSPFLLENSKVKSDIFVLVGSDSRPQEVGLSIKSAAGAAPTLVNASKQTRFRFRVKGGGRTTPHGRVGARVKAMLESLRFSQMLSESYSNNLTELHPRLPEILGALLLARYKHDRAGLADLCESLAEENPLRLRDVSTYERAVTDFLLASAVGMIPSEAWNRSSDAGGFLLAESSGELTAYLTDDKASKAELTNFLLERCYLDTPSTSRHDFGTVRQDESGSPYLDLCLQVRVRTTSPKSAKRKQQAQASKTKG